MTSENYPLLPMKRLASVTLGKMVQPTPSAETDRLAPYLRAAHVQPRGRILELEEQPMWFSAAELSALDLRGGDVVVVEGGAGSGRAAVLGEAMPGWGFQNSIIRLRSRDGLADGRFLAYGVQAALDDGQIGVVSSTSTIPHFTAEKVAAFGIPAPELMLQTRIAEFLDRETAEIDAFIADQEELIALLAERRAATISHAVTKGLDPSAPMKDSGVEWLGDVPAEWKVTSLKHFVEMISGFPFSSDEFSREPDAITLLRGLNVGVGRIDWSERVGWSGAIDARMKDYVLELGDVVVGLDRPVISAGVRVAEIGAEDLPSLLLQRVLRIRAVDGVSMKFVRYAISGDEFVQYIQPLFTGVSVPHLSPGQVGDFRVALPSRAKQEAIVVYLDREVTEVDAAIDDAREAIALSKERRAALISAAVTGKIDVRNHRGVD